jgi:hypothetical protein
MSAFFMDVSGDVWRSTGRGTGGDAVLVCDEPQDPDDRGEGEPDEPWTVASVTEWFGPLTEVGAVLSIRDQVSLEDTGHRYPSRRSA